MVRHVEQVADRYGVCRPRVVGQLPSILCVVADQIEKHAAPTYTMACPVCVAHKKRCMSPSVCRHVSCRSGRIATSMMPMSTPRQSERSRGQRLGDDPSLHENANRHPFKQPLGWGRRSRFWATVTEQNPSDVVLHAEIICIEKTYFECRSSKGFGQ